MRKVPLLMETAYVELLQRLQDDELSGFRNGQFVRKTVKGRDYWYFVHPQQNGQKRRHEYIGPASEELDRRVAEHKKEKSRIRERRQLVQHLLRDHPSSRPPGTIGPVLEALARSGVFRKRAVVVGTTAFQQYGPMLGVQFSHAATMTEDLDIAQFTSVSIAVDDAPDLSMLETLQSVDPDFRCIERPLWPHKPVTYRSQDFKVEFLAPNEGPDQDQPARLPALETWAQPLRYLDFLIYGERKAVLLHGAGVLVNVPEPARFALHKLLVSDAREGREKSGKDLQQALLMLEGLALHDPSCLDLRLTWEELRDRGPKWRQRTDRAVERLSLENEQGASWANRLRDWDQDRLE